MSLIKFRKIILEQGQTIENWLGENNPDKNTRYTFFDNEGSIVGEYIGDKIVAETKLGNAIEDAPQDGGLYGRKDGEWVEISNNGEGVVDEYFYYSKTYYTITNNSALFSNAWEHSLTVDPSEIERDSTEENANGTAQYPNGEIEGVIIPQGVANIGESAFDTWEANNRPLVIPDSVTSIGDYAFYGWKSNNQLLVIPDSVTSIGEGAFGEWELNEHPLVIPDSVTSIGEGAFRYWYRIPYVEMKSETPPVLGDANAFDNQNHVPIYVPDESFDDYRAATNWADLADRIFPISDKDAEAT